jgi:hypothetical protein
MPRSREASRLSAGPTGCSLVGSSGHRTRDLLRRLVSSGSIEEDDARDAYYLLQTDDLHNLGGPPW